MPALTVVLEDVSSLWTEEMARVVTNGQGNFGPVSYQEAAPVSDAAGGPPRQVQISVCVGRHVLTTQVVNDATSNLWTIPALKVNSVDATSWWATLNTGAPSRQTQGNAVRWLVDDLDAWSVLANNLTGAQTNVSMMQLHLDIPTYDPAPDNEDPATVLAFGPGLSATEGRPANPSDIRIERLLLLLAQHGVTLRVQIPAMSLDSHAIPAILLAGGILAGGAALFLLLGVMAGLLALLVVLVLVSVGLILLNLWLRNAIGNPDQVATWFNAAGEPDVVKTFPAPLASIIHAKIVTVDSTAGFLLGSPFIQGYWDTPAHDLDDRRRGMTAGTEKGPIHDVSARLRGPAVGYLDEVFNLHWNVSDPSDPPLPVPPALPAAVSPSTNADDLEFAATTQIVRTLDAGPFSAYPNGEQGVLESYLRAIAFAKRFIYMENQYFTEDTIIDALCDAMKTNSSLEVILVLNIKPDIPMYPPWQRAAVKKIRAAAGGSNADSRLAVFTTWSHKPPDQDNPKPRFCRNYIHAKAAVVDNKWATVGSANLDGASLSFFQVLHDLIGDIRNTEANCVIYEDPAPAPGASAVDALRRALWAEHLGITDASGAPNPADPSLDDDGSTAKWVPFWGPKATAKLQQLAANPGTPAAPHILPWALDHTADTSENYLNHLLAAQQPPLTMPDLDLMDPGPQPWDFKSGQWKTP